MGIKADWEDEETGFVFPPQRIGLSQPGFAGESGPLVVVVHTPLAQVVHVAPALFVLHVVLPAAVVVLVGVCPPGDVVEAVGTNDPEALHPARSTTNRVPVIAMKFRTSHLDP